MSEGRRKVRGTPKIIVMTDRDLENSIVNEERGTEDSPQKKRQILDTTSNTVSIMREQIDVGPIPTKTEEDAESDITMNQEEEEGGTLLFKKDTMKSCAYCLRRDLKVVLMLENCGHFYCPHCLLQQYNISTVTQGLGLPQPGRQGSQKLIRCYLCKQYHAVNEKQLTQLHNLALNKKIRPPATKTPVFKGLKRCQTCFRISLNVEAIMDAEFECLNCNTLLCQQCLDIHFSNPKNEQHRVLRLLEEANLEQTSEDFCMNHKERLLHYCYDDNKALCVVCAHYEDHNDHKVKPLKEILAEQEAITKETRLRLTETIKSIEMGFFQMNVTTLNAQRDLYLQKLKGDFSVMYKMLEVKYSELYSKITQAFTHCQEESEAMRMGFQSYLSRLYFLKALNPQRDIDVLHINNLADDVLSLHVQTEHLHDFDVATYSQFVHEPMDRVRKLLTQYDFIEISERSLKQMRHSFIDSKILKNRLITTDFLTMFSGEIKQTELLYKMKRDGCSPEIFHKRCDNKGATLILVSANKGHVFGAFNPTSWVSQYCYSECDGAFLFSLQEPTNERKPFKCPLRSYKHEFAIKQSESGFSPGFGEANNCDFFIAFKSPERSYCKLGTVYEPPEDLAKGMSSEEVNCLLAGKETEWEIDEIEIYSIKF